MNRMLVLLGTAAAVSAAMPAGAATRFSIRANDLQYLGTATFIGQRDASGGIGLADLTSVDAEISGDFPAVRFGLSDLTGFSFRSATDFSFGFLRERHGLSGFASASFGPSFTSQFVTTAWSGFPATVSINYRNFTVDVTEIADPIPEPATWAMMLVGFGLIGAATRYRRRSVAAAIA